MKFRSPSLPWPDGIQNISAGTEMAPRNGQKWGPTVAPSFCPCLQGGAEDEEEMSRALGPGCQAKVFELDPGGY